jgi:hypothetical protein
MARVMKAELVNGLMPVETIISQSTHRSRLKDTVGREGNDDNVEFK